MIEHLAASVNLTDPSSDPAFEPPRASHAQNHEKQAWDKGIVASGSLRILQVPPVIIWG
jgi:hypothetical protein